MGDMNSQLGSTEEEELKMKIVLYYHTLVRPIFEVSDSIFCLVPRNPFAVVRIDAAAKLQEVEQAPVH